MWRSVQYMILWHTPVYAKDMCLTLGEQDANPRHTKFLFIWFFPSLIRWSTDLEIYDFMQYYVSKAESIEWFTEGKTF